MSLLDLHKRASRAKKTLKQNCAVSADEFIDQAINYAQGLDNVIPLHRAAEKHQVEQSPQTVDLTLVNNDHCTQAKPKVPFRRATFTLSESSISQLNQQAKTFDCAKSQLIRTLIHQFDQLPQAEQHRIINQQKTRDQN